jgi:glutathione synthase/RimK-type ligase-like ATP-grasp enzyme
MSTGTAEARTTTDPAEIKQWVEERGGKPARVKSTASGKGGGVLRIDFPGYSGEDSLEEISWEEWLDTFEKRKLAFLHQDHLKSGKESRFFKLIERGNEKE